MIRTAPLLIALLVLAMPAAHANSRIGIIDHLFGASNTNAVAGHGRLTAAVSKDGDLTVLSWPSPSLRDHLAYISSNALDARDLPRFGAHEGMGSFIGLYVTTDEGRSLTWLRDDAWRREQSYSRPDAPVPVTRFQHDDLDLEVTLIDIVSPDVDLLTRRVRVERRAGSPVTAVSLVVYENLAPSVSRIPEFPIGDWALDPINEQLAIWDDESGSIVHFHPADGAALTHFLEVVDLGSDRDYGAVEELMALESPSASDVRDLASSLDERYGPGVAALVTTEPPPESFHVGTDATPLCERLEELLDNLVELPQHYPDAPLPLDAQTAALLGCADPFPELRDSRGWAWAPGDALDEIERAVETGQISGSPVSAARANGALVTSLAFEGDVAEGSAVFAFGSTLAEARGALASGTAVSADDRLARAEDAATEALAHLALPDPALGERVVDVARRALVNTYVARDREVGTLVASVTRQPPYYLDWPRDGAFFSVGLDVAGRLDWVTQRAEWYTGIIRDKYTKGTAALTPYVPVDPDTGNELFPANAWEMNYYSDGTLGGPIRFEIDNTALHVWSLATHAAYLEGDERSAFIADVWPSTRAALDLLERWRDHDTDLPALANEDDHLELTSKLHGAVTVHAAMDAGARLANAAGEVELARVYLARKQELADAILEHYYDPEVGLFRVRRDGPAGPHRGSTAWLIWPGRVLDRDDPRVEAQLLADMEQIVGILDGSIEVEGAQYLAKNILSAALYGEEDGSRALAREALVLLADVATADTDHFGEAYLRVDDGDEIAWDNHVAPPHVWEGMLFYLAAMALTDRSLFDPEERELPLPDPAPASGCGCAASSSPFPTSAALLGIGLLLLRARARARAR